MVHTRFLLCVFTSVACKMIYKHHFRPHTTLLWNCRYIVSRNKYLFDKNWLEKGILSVMHLLDNPGNIIPFKTISSKYNINDRRQYSTLFRAIPQSSVMMSYNLINNINPVLPSPLINGHNITDNKTNNITIRHILIDELYPFSSNRIYIFPFFSKKAEHVQSK